MTLPKAFAIDQRHLGNICSRRPNSQPTHCAGRQPIGTVKDETPLLEQPLAGPGLRRLGLRQAAPRRLHPRRPGHRHAPGRIGLVGGRLRTTVPVIPDVPIGHFQLTLFGGKQGYLSNTQSLCARPPAATVEFIGQSGKETTRRVALKTACAAKKKHGEKAGAARDGGGNPRVLEQALLSGLCQPRSTQRRRAF